MPALRSALLSAFVGLAAVAFATPVAAQNVADLQITPEAMSIKVGQAQSLSPEAFDGVGNIIGTAKFTYRSLNPSVARVDREGRVVGAGVGTTTIEVRSGKKMQVVPVQVSPGDNPPAAEPRAAPAPVPSITLPPPPAGTATIVIDPSTVYLLQTESDRLFARALSADGTVLGDVRVIWHSLTPGIVVVGDSLNGNVVGSAPGVGTVQASLGNGMVATAPVQVVPPSTPFGFPAPRLVLSPDQIDTLEVVVPSQSDRKIESALTYVTTNPAVVTVGPTGIMQAKGPGQAEIVVTGYFQEKRLKLVVHRPIAFFVTDPPAGAQVTVPLDGFRGLTAHAQAADSTLIPDAPLVWKVADTAIARYDTATARLFGHREGTTTLTLTVRGYVPKVWTLRVVPGGLALDKKRIGVTLGTTTTFAAELRDIHGADFGPAPEARWSTDRSDVLKVTDGKVSAVGLGRAQVIVSVPWGRADTATVFVTGDFFLASDRKVKGAPGIFQGSLQSPDKLMPIATDSGSYADPAPSPDRLRIAYAARTGGTDFDIWVMDADGGNARRLTSDSAAEVHPAWTPDGKAIVYTAIGKDRDQLMLINSDGSNRRPLSPTNLSAGNPAVSADGKWVAYIGGRDRRRPDVFLAGLTRDTSITVTATKEKETSVAWFQNGDLAYATEAPSDTKGYEIVRLSAGTNQRSIVASSAYPIASFALSRDGTMVAYVTVEPNPGNKQQKTKTVFYIGSLTPGSTPQAVALPTTEFVGSPAF
ncbi:MAG: Ig-like domain-containing protein [Gemmatimonadales bacterium]